MKILVHYLNGRYFWVDTVVCHDKNGREYPCAVLVSQSGYACYVDIEDIFVVDDNVLKLI